MSTPSNHIVDLFHISSLEFPRTFHWPSTLMLSSKVRGQLENLRHYHGLQSACLFAASSLQGIEVK